MLLKVPLGDAGALLGGVTQLPQSDGAFNRLRGPALVLRRLDGGDGKRPPRQGPGQHLPGLLHGEAPHVHAADGLPGVKGRPGPRPGAEAGVARGHDGGGQSQRDKHRGGGALLQPRASGPDFICHLSHEALLFGLHTWGRFSLWVF